VAVDIAEYRRRAEEFSAELNREYYLHLAGRKPELEIDAIYRRFDDLFEPAAVDALRTAVGAAGGDERRRLRYLLHFAFDGLVGARTKAEQEELARLEASLEVELDGEAIGYRQVSAELANEPEGERRAALAAARDAVLAERLDPLHRSALERARAACVEFGWSGPAAAYADLRGLDLAGLADRTAGFLAATDSRYAGVADPELERTGVPPLGQLRRSDLPRFFRAVHLDGPYRAEEMLPTLAGTLAELGIALDRQPNVTVDADPRPTKSPRAFCSAPRVPDEIYLVVAPVGGRGDYDALFHEAGHVEHYAHADAAHPFEYRHLGDNGVTESFAFLLEGIIAEPRWLADRLGAADPERTAAHARAAKLVMVRRYCAKLAYELELGAPDPDLSRMPDRYSELLGSAIRAEWPRETWLDDVDEGFYVACYLRAWALETHWRRALRERFGERWFASAAAGRWLAELWREGQRLGAEELLAERLGEELDFGALAAELTGAG
jgi:hypothetical protein